MWISELVKEFFEWITGSNNYSECTKCKNIVKFFFFGCISGVILTYLLTVETEDFRTVAYFIFMSLKVYIITDLCLYAARFWHLCGGYSEPHSLLLLHTAIHMLLISNIIHAYYYEYKYDEDRHSKYDYYVIEEIDNFKSTFCIYPLVKLRVFIYAILLVLTVLTSPCLISTILRRRRERIQYFERIRLMRAQHDNRYINLHMPLLDNQDYNLEMNQANNRNIAQFDQELDYNRNAPYLPVDNNQARYDNINERPLPVLEPRNNSINDRILDLIQGIQPATVSQETIMRLKRVSYEQERLMLAYDECSICLYQLSEFQDEKLIYLPCSRKHIFHSNCIIDWLKHECSCPLCKAPITLEAVRNANY